jgi:biopolymer transport protein ExbB
VNTVDAFKQVLLRSGASWVLWILAVSLVVTVAITVERWFFYRRREGDLQALAWRLGAHLADRDFDAAAKELGQSRSVAAAIAAAGLELAHGGPAAADRAMQSAAALERRGLERWLAYLGTLGNNAPFVGLFGTVVGVIGAFEELGRGRGGGPGTAGAGQVASQLMMGSIAEALVATAAGILAALPAVIAFNYFQRRVASLLAGTEVLSNLVLAYLSHGRAPDSGT